MLTYNGINFYLDEQVLPVPLVPIGQSLDTRAGLYMQQLERATGQRCGPTEAGDEELVETARAAAADYRANLRNIAMSAGLVPSRPEQRSANMATYLGSKNAR